MITAAVSMYEGRQLSPSARTAPQVAASIALRIVGRSPLIVRMGAAIVEATPQSAPVLLVGAPGSGKRFLARLMHEFGSLSTRPFVVLSGADSGIDEAKLRRIVGDATNATLFVDAIECLSVEMQDLLYHCAFVDQNTAPARVIACSERMLDNDVTSGQFRSELLGGCRIRVRTAMGAGIRQSNGQFGAIFKCQGRASDRHDLAGSNSHQARPQKSDCVLASG